MNFDLLLAHAVNSAHYDMYTRQGVFETAKELVAEGRARHFGISYHDGPELLEQILTEHPEIEAVQLQVNYEDWESPSVRSREVYEVATAHGVPVIVSANASAHRACPSASCSRRWLRSSSREEALVRMRSTLHAMHPGLQVTRSVTSYSRLILNARYMTH